MWSETGRDPCVLVVDDHPSLRELLEPVLAHAFPKYRVETATSGEEAVEAVSRLSVSAVVMDINLPGISGIEAARRIKAAAPDVPIVMLSIHEEEAYVRDSMSAGASAYVMKHRMGRDLLPALEDVLTVPERMPPAAGSENTGGHEWSG